MGNYLLGNVPFPRGARDSSHNVNAQCFKLESKWSYEAWSIQAATNKFSRVKPEEIVAVTFSKKAAAEIFDKIIYQIV